MENDTQFDLSLIETRILGCLREKETTTPDYYPLTLNALTNACNQKSNRNPVLELEESEVDRALESLRLKGWASLITMANSHVAKHRHKLNERFPTASPLQLAILTELMLRGPQTAGELRARCERMTATGTIDTVRDTLEELANGDRPLVIQLPRQPGKKDSRYAHLLSGEPNIEENAASATSHEPMKVKVTATLPPEAEERIANLETELAELKEQFTAFKAQFE